MRQLIRLLGYVRPYRGQFIIANVCVILAGVFVMASPIVTGWAIDFGLDPQYGVDGGIIGADGEARFVVFAAIAVVLFAIGRGLAAFGQQYLGEFTAQRVAYDLRNELYDNLQRLSYAYHDSVQTGQIMSRATQDVENVRIFVNMGALRMSYVLLILGFAAVGMFWINWQLALISGIAVPIMAWRSVVMVYKSRPIWMAIQENQGVMTQVAEEGLSGIRVVKAFSREPYESARFAKQAQRQADLSLNQAKLQAVHQPLMAGIGLLQVGVTAGAGALMISRGTLTSGELLTFLLWLNLLQMPVRSIGFVLNIIARAVGSADRVFEIIDAQSAVKERQDARDIGEIEGHVRFEGVSFAYDKLSSVVEGLDIDAKPGQIVALLGPTGSGKTTVVNLIPRFYDVTEGRVTIDGTDLRDLTLGSLRRSIGIVQQDVFLFIGTIRDNIAYGKPDATLEEVEAAAKAANIHEFIKSLPYGYDEWVGERGVTLSGGQKQRIAIARTLLMDPKILIFDDSTASVDTQTEFLIQRALQQLMEGRTTFVIAQRLRTVMRADQILVLDKGRIVERGTHDELVQGDGLYRRIYELELRDQVEALGPVPTASSGNGHGPASQRPPDAPRFSPPAPVPGGGS
ncbi:MAG: ABC transporter ATP-binding protein [Tepidiformaceae bacterium]